jgi:hypothetical protein
LPPAPCELIYPGCAQAVAKAARPHPRGVGFAMGEGEDGALDVDKAPAEVDVSQSPEAIARRLRENARKGERVDISQLPSAVSARLSGTGPVPAETPRTEPKPTTEYLERIGGEVLDPGGADPARVEEVDYAKPAERPAQGGGGSQEEIARRLRAHLGKKD